MLRISKTSAVQFLNDVLKSDPMFGKQLCEPILQGKSGAAKSFVDLLNAMMEDDPQDLRPVYVRNSSGEFEIVRFELDTDRVTPAPAVQNTNKH